MDTRRVERLPLAEAVAVVTGAARGIGRGAALCLGAAGATVYVTDRDTRATKASPLPGTTEDTAEEVTARGGNGIPLRVDHTDDADVEGLFDRVQHEHGGLDVLVANAFDGNALPLSGGEVWTLPMALWDHMITAGVRGHLATTRLAAPLLLARGGGLVALTSFLDRDAPVMAGNLFYDLAMTATNRLAHGLAHELAPHGVTAVALSPGVVHTEAITAALGDVDPPPGMESVEYTGRAIVALATDPDAARHNGRTLHVAELARDYGFTDIDGTQPGAPAPPTG